MSCTLVQFWGSVPRLLTCGRLLSNIYFFDNKKLRDPGQGITTESLAPNERPLPFGWCVVATEQAKEWRSTCLLDVAANFCAREFPLNLQDSSGRG
jgi:hypothetical protein